MDQKEGKIKLTDQEKDDLLAVLKDRFEKNKERHPLLDWEKVAAALEANPDKLQTLHAMEETGGEPDVIGYHENSGKFVFCDCSPETPAGRRKISYDEAAREARTHGRPDHSAKGMAKQMGLELLSEEEYLNLQKLGSFDLKTSSWIETPEDIRKKGGALYGDRRYGRVFIYHNGAESWYSVRGFRGLLHV